jgi:sugar phosphate isomerase/epimerase
MKPKVAVTNIFGDAKKLKAFALEHGFLGIEWSLYLDNVPETPSEESRWVKEQSALRPFEVRYHCPFYQIDLGHDDPREAKAAESLFQRIIRLVSKVSGRYLTIHIGLGHNSMEPLSWETTIDNLRRIVQYGRERRVSVCLENLAWGWTSRPHLFEKLVRRSGAGVTFDIGHAYVCESVVSQHYTLRDFVTPHPDRVYNAHIYHTEISRLGHTPPGELDDIKDRLSLLLEIGCGWWVIEIPQEDELLQTKKIVDAYLRDSDEEEQTEAGVLVGRASNPVEEDLP